MHIVVGLSGGVDSAVAAWRLQQQGHRVSGLFMKNWEDDDRDGHCAAAADLVDAERVCERLGIELHTVNFAFEYWDRVFAHFLAEHRAGRTPNPDVLCNKEIKFKEFVHHARTLGAERIATGHYVRRAGGGADCRLLKGVDPAKDQSYFLHAVDQAALAGTEFPLGTLTKPEVRRIAARLGLPNHAKKDSTGICFIGERRLRTFLSRYLVPQPGAIHDLAGRPVGRHAGLMFYTIGQRRGLDIGGPGDAWYVAAKDLQHNVLRVVQGHAHPALYHNELIAGQLDWIAGRAPSLPLACHAKTRYRQADQPGELTALDTGRVRVRFAQPQRAITPGQSVVFYDGETCLGGGVIESGARTIAPTVAGKQRAA